MIAYLIFGLLVGIVFLHGRYLRNKADEPKMLMREPRQCVAFFKRTSNPLSKSNLEHWHQFLPPLTKEDHL